MEKRCEALLIFPHMAYTVHDIVTQTLSCGQQALCPQEAWYCAMPLKDC